MAHIRKHPTTGKPQVRYIDPWRKERSRTFDMMRDARAFMAEVEVAIRSGEYLDPKRASISLEEWSSTWLQSRVGVRQNTRARDEATLRNHVLPEIGHLSLSEIGFEHIQTLVQKLTANGLAPATVRKAHQVTALTLDFAVKSRRIGWNLARGVELPRASESTARFISGSEIDHLADTIDPYYRLLVMLGGYCGMRWGEAVGLHLEQVDLLHRRITVDRTLVEVGGQFHTGPPKTRASLRQISLPPFMVNEVEKHLGAYPTAGEGLIMTSAKGTYLRRSNFQRRVWTPAVEAADLSPLRFHDLRHSHVALLIAQGEHPKLIADRLGHASPTVTMTIYAHLFPGLDEEAAERLEKARDDIRRTSDGLSSS